MKSLVTSICDAPVLPALVLVLTQLAIRTPKTPKVGIAGKAYGTEGLSHQIDAT
jgi:hypothetical protein